VQVPSQALRIMWSLNHMMQKNNASRMERLSANGTQTAPFCSVNSVGVRYINRSPFAPAIAFSVRLPSLVFRLFLLNSNSRK
jgi:hypothetical protein